MAKSAAETLNAPANRGPVTAWPSSAKTAVGTATNRQSVVWYTVHGGVLTEVYFPSIDTANIRDQVFAVTGPDGFLSLEDKDCEPQFEYEEPHVPLLKLTNSHRKGAYTLRREILSDALRPALLQRITFEPEGPGFRLFAMLNPHLSNTDTDPIAHVVNCRGTVALVAERDWMKLAMVSSVGWRGTSIGYLGDNDGYQLLRTIGSLDGQRPEAHDGNLVMTGEVALPEGQHSFVLAIGFGRSVEEAIHHAQASIISGWGAAVDDFKEGWHAFHQRTNEAAKHMDPRPRLYDISRIVLYTHDSKSFPGGVAASLSHPFGGGNSHGVPSGGYHLSWPRDSVEVAEAYLSMDNPEHARESLVYLLTNQKTDGSWPQNMWLDGRVYWSGIQMDETASVVVLAQELAELDCLGCVSTWNSICRAAGFLLLSGPGTQQDRWEENEGYTIYTLATEVAALLSAAHFARENGEDDSAEVLESIADAWNESIEDWTFVSDTPLAKEVGVPGYYIRVAERQAALEAKPADGTTEIKNGGGSHPSWAVVSCDALALVHYGLRDANDPRLVDTVKVIDAKLRTETKTGPAWKRYSFDGYGETADGQPFNGAGIGRSWPIMAGERAHYELARGNKDFTKELMHVMERQTSPGGMIPEQVWDADDIPGRGLFNGRPAGSAMPLTWAHAEYLKLARSLHEGRIFNVPKITLDRYSRRRTKASVAPWSFSHPTRFMCRDRDLRLILGAPATVHWSADGWKTTQETATRPLGISGVHIADVPLARREAPGKVDFTFHWEAGNWEGRNFSVRIEDREPLYHQ